MTTPLRNPLFQICLVGFIGIFIYRSLGTADSFLESYVIDFCAIVVFLTLSLVLLRVIKRDSEIQMNITRLTAALILYSFWMEFIVPSIWTNFESDPWDILVYFLGAGAFSLFINNRGPHNA